jgi:hypothetical protein
MRRGAPQERTLSHMMKRAIPLLFAVAIVLTLAPSAMANHCYGCKLYPEPNEEPPRCVRYSNYGWTECYPNYETGFCDTYNWCGPHAMLAPLASEFEVASVVASVPAASPATR